MPAGARKFLKSNRYPVSARAVNATKGNGHECTERFAWIARYRWRDGHILGRTGMGSGDCKNRIVRADNGAIRREWQADGGRREALC